MTIKVFFNTIQPWIIFRTKTTTSANKTPAIALQRPEFPDRPSFQLPKTNMRPSILNRRPRSFNTLFQLPRTPTTISIPKSISSHFSKSRAKIRFNDYTLSKESPDSPMIYMQISFPNINDHKSTELKARTISIDSNEDDTGEHHDAAADQSSSEGDDRYKKGPILRDIYNLIESEASLEEFGSYSGSRQDTESNPMTTRLTCDPVIVSTNLQRAAWRSSLDIDADVICIQEGKFVNQSRLLPGFISNGPNNDIRTWTKLPHILCKNVAHLQILEVKIKENKVWLLNAHLSTNGTKKKTQLEEISRDIEHIFNSATDPNVILVGDLNQPGDKINIFGCSRKGPDVGTRRADQGSQFLRQLDHVFACSYVDLNVEWMDCGSDHMMAIITVQRTARVKRQTCPVAVPRVSKRLTLNSRPETWKEYPSFNLYRYLGHNRLRRSLQTVQQISETREAWYKSCRGGKLLSSKDWSNTLRFCNLSPYSTLEPLLSREGRPINTRRLYITETIGHLEVATGFKYSKSIAKGVEVDEATKNWLIDQMMTGSSMIRLNSACGPDGVHPMALAQFERDNPSHMDILRNIMETALNRPNIFSSRVSLIPKKGTTKMRPIQVLNLSFKSLVKGLSSEVNALPLDNPDSMFGFEKGKTTHMAFNLVRDKLLEGVQPLVFLDFSAAYNRANREAILELVKKKAEDRIYSIVKQAMDKQSVEVFGEHYTTNEGLPQGSSWSPKLFNLLIDHLITLYKKEQPEVSLVSFADDLCAIGRLHLDKFNFIAESLGLYLNMGKCATFHQTIKGIPRKKKYKYLGSSLHESGNVKGLTAIKASIRKKAQCIRRVSKHNPVKGLHMTKSLINGTLNFHQQRTDLTEFRTSQIKSAMCLPKSLQQDIVTKAIETMETNKSDEYTISLIKLLKYNGVKVGDEFRIKFNWEYEMCELDFVNWKIEDIKTRLSQQSKSQPKVKKSPAKEKQPTKKYQPPTKKYQPTKNKSPAKKKQPAENKQPAKMKQPAGKKQPTGKKKEKNTIEKNGMINMKEATIKQPAQPIKRVPHILLLNLTIPPRKRGRPKKNPSQISEKHPNTN